MKGSDGSHHAKWSKKSQLDNSGAPEPRESAKYRPETEARSVERVRGLRRER
jgi:hypothetical protein